MTFEVDLSKVPYWIWAALWAGSIWVLKTWLEKKFQPLATPKTPQELERDEIDLGRRILQSKAFVDAADHQVYTTMLSDRFHQAVEGVVVSSAKITSLIDTKAGERVAAQVGEKISGMGDTQRMMLEQLKDIKGSLDESKISMARLEEKIKAHIEHEEG